MTTSIEGPHDDAPPRADGLAASYALCRQLNKRHGTTYYWSTMLLPKPRRPHVHALYGFCRRADDIVDELGDAPIPARADALRRLADRLFAGVEAGRSDDPVLAAVVDTIVRFSIEPDIFRRFLRSMEMDLTLTSYSTYADLCAYMDGSAAAVGEMMLPVLGATAAAAVAPARALGIAFQLTNFLRDVAEDLDRGRVYLPQDEIEAFGAEPALAERRVTPGWIALMRSEVARTREVYREADAGLPWLPPASARCINAARVLYSRILDRIEAIGYDVFSSRAEVPAWQKLAVGARLLRPAPRAAW